jgi:hypothetical protein
MTNNVQEWEYLVEEPDLGWGGKGKKKLQALLSARGREGWELVAIHGESGWAPAYVVFKRPKS